MSTAIELQPIEVERERRIQGRSLTAAEVDAQLEQVLAPFAGTALGTRAHDAYEFAKRLDYDHPGLSAAAYLAHPVRVASLASRLIRPREDESVVLALLHNVFELSSVSPAQIAAGFGAPIAKAIEVLTVDRTRKDREYTVGYYRGICDMPRYVRMIKVLDKLDNLFILCLNPDDEVRRTYLADIETFIVPMAAADQPDLVPYLHELIGDCRVLGHRALSTFETSLSGRKQS
jgi:(p)ppGpp synthase/HD superfamily hydrolase